MLLCSQTLNISTKEINEEKQEHIYEDEECDILYIDLQCPSYNDNTQVSKKHCKVMIHKNLQVLH